MTTYAVHVQVTTHDGEFSGSRAVPTFYLDSRVQGIMSTEHAEQIAAGIVNPLGAIPAGDLHIGAYRIDPAREDAELSAWAAEQSARDAEHAAAVCQDSGHATWCAGPTAHALSGNTLADGTPQECHYARWQA